MTTIPYRISSIKTEQFASFPENFIKEKNVKFDTEFNFSIKKETNIIRCISIIKCSQEEKILLKLELHCFFEIAPESIEQLKKEKKISKDFLRYMATIVVGISRGVIHARTEGSVLNAIVLPPINLVDIITQDFAFSISNE